MLDRLAGHPNFCFLDGYSGYNQIFIAFEDKEKTTFTCPYGTFAFRRMSFELCNTSASFQTCMMYMFSNFVEEAMEIFMNDFSVYGSNFEKCLENLETILQRCQEKNLASFEFGKMPFHGNIRYCLRAQISAARLEVNQAKVSVTKTLLPPTTVKGIRSFLGHVGFYRRFIRDFSKRSRPLCRLLEKDAKFDFDESCRSAFEEIKPRLVTTPIMVTRDWNKEFEIMCDPVTLQREQH